MKKWFLLPIAALLWPVPPCFALAGPWQSNPQGQVRIVSADNVAPKTGTLLLGLQFKPAPGWYVYWKIAGEAGFAPKVTWDGSQGIGKPDFLWPAPTRFVLPGDIVEYGYQGEVIYPVKADITDAGKNLHVVAHLSYLTCNTSCIPYKYNLTLTIPTGGTASQSDPNVKPLLDQYLARVPSPEKSDQEIQKQAPTVHLNPMPEPNAPESSSAWTFLLLAFFGGLLLNVMPCVLPVLSLKLLGLIQQAGQSRRLVIRHALLSAAGILVSFAALAVFAVTARAAGRAAGWGIQFQNPIFVGILATVVFLFALNLWGIFEVNLPGILGRFATTYGRRESAMAYFTSGLFATLLATPCSAPLLGPAMGFAISQSPGIILAAFLAAGTGMASPYLALAVFPSSLRWLPRPGMWMVRLKAVFGVFLMATALWLGWVFVHQVRPVARAPFSESDIQIFLAQGKPVLVDVTADWCVTCKYNERAVLGSAEVRHILQQRGVVIMRADWTNYDESIRQYLTKFHRSGIPFYAYYEPGRDPVLLSEFLTKQQVLNALNSR